MEVVLQNNIIKIVYSCNQYIATLRILFVLYIIVFVF